MKSANKQLERTVQSWMNRVERRRPLTATYNPELRDLPEHIILKADENKDLGRNYQLLSLVADSDAASGYLHAQRGL